MKLQRLALVLAGAGLCTGFVAQAAAAENTNWYIAPELGTVITNYKAEADNGVFGALKVGKELSKSWDVQLGGNYGFSDGRSQYSSSGHYIQTGLTAEALYFFDRSTWSPFLLGGLGWGRDRFNYSATSTWKGKQYSSSSLLTDVGAGVQYAFSERQGLQFDVRYLVTRPTHNNPSTGAIGNTYIGVGYIYHFGDATPEHLELAVADYKPVPIAPVVVTPPPAPAPTPAPVVVEPPKPVVETPPPPPPAPAPAPKVVQLRNLRGDTLFASGSTKLSPRAAQEIDSAFTESHLAFTDLSSIKVVGHADRMGKPAINQKLSEQRALAVKEYLVSKGVDASIITAEGHGSAEPVTNCPAKLHGKKLSACLAPDRRIVITGEGKVTGN